MFQRSPGITHLYFSLFFIICYNSYLEYYFIMEEPFVFFSSLWLSDGPPIMPGKDSNPGPGTRDPEPRTRRRAHNLAKQNSNLTLIFSFVIMYLFCFFCRLARALFGLTTPLASFYLSKWRKIFTSFYRYDLKTITTKTSKQVWSNKTELKRDR